MEKLVKEFTNSYGKFSQSINPRKVFSPATGEMVTLGESQPSLQVVLQPLPHHSPSGAISHFARVERSTRRDLVRNHGNQRHHRWFVDSVPVPENFTVVDDYYESNPLKLKDQVSYQLPEIPSRFGCSDLMKEIDAFAYTPNAPFAYEDDRQ